MVKPSPWHDKCQFEFNGWDGVLPNNAISIAAIDRLHHATIFETNVESYRHRAVFVAETPLSGAVTRADTLVTKTPS